MKKKMQIIKWKLCQAYFSKIILSKDEDLTFDELCTISKVSTQDAKKIIPKNNKDYNFYFLNVLLSKLDEETLVNLQEDISEDTISSEYEKFLEGITLRLESYLPYREAFKFLSQGLSIRAVNVLKLFENNCYFMMNLLDLVEGNQNQSIKYLKAIALNIVFVKAMSTFLSENDNNLDATIRNIDKNLRDFEDLGYITGLIKK